MKIVTPEQMQDIEKRSGRAGISTKQLMENAGLAVARYVRQHIGRVIGVPMVILVGPGNNGGDGLVAARHLLAWGGQVTAYLTRTRPEDPNLREVLSRGGRVIVASEGDGLAELRTDLGHAEMVIDAVLGTGNSRPISSTTKTILRLLSRARADRPQMGLVAIDMPSGLDSATGNVDPECVAADLTVALGYPKIGHYTSPGGDYCGHIEVVNICLPPEVDCEINLELMTDEWARASLPERPQAAHKGTFGRALIVAGSRRYVGAAMLAASAAGRVGAGLVTLAVPESLRASVASGAPEPTYIPLPESSPGDHSHSAADEIIAHLSGYNSLLVGCGLGLGNGATKMVEQLLYEVEHLPQTVIDADGLNILARSKKPAWWNRMSKHTVVTPHTGEMERLAGGSAVGVQSTRIAIAQQSAKNWNKTIVLKGAYTIVASPKGGAKISPFANPGLASAGTGDVLAGAITGLLAQGLDLDLAAALGVYLHGLAGAQVRNAIGDTGMLASDLLSALPLAIKELMGHL